jgi:polyisoprenoid-binding protein YceI
MAWVIDPAHSHIQFTVRHMMISNVRGRFENFTGVVEFDEQNPARSTVGVQIEAASLNTKEAQRDNHLRSPDFLNAEQFPYLTFKSRRVEQLDEAHGRIVGDLTIRNVTKEVTLDVEYSGQAKSPWGMTSAGFTASAKINRKDWGLNWNVALETGGWLVGDEVRIDIELEIVKQPEQVLQAEAVAA